MKPEVDQILGTSAGLLSGTLAPLLPAQYAQASASILGLMLALCAQEYERGADIRAADNTDMRALFKHAASSIADGELKTMLLRASETADNSLKISALNAENVELRRMLIHLQMHAEENGLKDVERRIWTVLKASADRRLLRLA